MSTGSPSTTDARSTVPRLDHVTDAVAAALLLASLVLWWDADHLGSERADVVLVTVVTAALTAVCVLLLVLGAVVGLTSEIWSPVVGGGAAVVSALVGDARIATLVIPLLAVLLGRPGWRPVLLTVGIAILAVRGAAEILGVNVVLFVVVCLPAALVVVLTVPPCVRALSLARRSGHPPTAAQVGDPTTDPALRSRSAR